MMAETPKPGYLVHVIADTLLRPLQSISVWLRDNSTQSNLTTLLLYLANVIEKRSFYHRIPRLIK